MCEPWRQTDYILEGNRFDRITIGSIREAILHDPRVFWGETAVIVLSSYQQEDIIHRLKQADVPVCTLVFDDVITSNGRCFTRQMASTIASFLRTIAENDTIRYIHIGCDSGVSRSSGCAASLLRRFGEADVSQSLFASPYFQPNARVAEILSQELQVPFALDELSGLIEENKLALQSAIQKSRGIQNQENL